MINKNRIITYFVIIILIVSGCRLKQDILVTETPISEYSHATSDPQSAIYTIIGQWERHSVLQNEDRVFTEHLVFNPNGSYTIEARYDDTNDLVADATGDFSFTNNTITFYQNYEDPIISSFYFDGEGNYLIIDNDPDKFWKRIE